METKTFKSLKTLTLLALLFLPHAIDASPEHEIVIAIIDTGVDIHHPYLQDHIWSNRKEKPNFKDNDGNGYAQDFHGWNFASNNNDLSDDHGHGTHIAGVILQNSGNAKVKFMVLKYFDPLQTGEKNLINTVKAIRYATLMGVDIINYSGGGDVRSALEEEAVKEAERKGILFIAAAGNEGRNTDIDKYYPAGYSATNIISVGAMDEKEHLMEVSNFGKVSVDIVAPGKNILSTLPSGKFGQMTGTSQATAWVTGLAAQILYQEGKHLSPSQIKGKIMNYATKDLSLANKVRSEAKISRLEPALGFSSHSYKFASMVNQ